jgi:predicted metal-binding membrane protein
MSMMWMRMPGQSWLGVAGSFIGMWIAMMVLMMLPSLIPKLRQYRRAIRETGGLRVGRLTALVGVGYFFVWTLVGLLVLPIGVALDAIAMSEPAFSHTLPIVIAMVVLIAGGIQVSPWKGRQIAACRDARDRTVQAAAGTAWRHGMRLGCQCVSCCGNLMVILLVIGIMDLRAMAAVTAAITLERLAPAGERIARVIGAVVVVAGVLLVARAAGLG